MWSEREGEKWSSEGRGVHEEEEELEEEGGIEKGAWKEKRYENRVG